jgi:hypothetical protein
MSAIQGLRLATTAINQTEVVGITMLVLVLLFSVQRFGTAKVAAAFGPIVALWMMAISAVAFYSLHTYGWGIWRVSASGASAGCLEGCMTIAAELSSHLTGHRRRARVRDCVDCSLDPLILPP